MPEPSLAVFVAHSTRIFPDFPHNERSKNERLPLLHFAFFPLNFAFNQQVKKQRIQNQNIINQKSNATPYGRPSTTKNALNEDGARGRTAVIEWNEFAVLAFFWFLFWGNAKKGTKTRSNKQKPIPHQPKDQMQPIHSGIFPSWLCLNFSGQAQTVCCAAAPFRPIF